MVGSEMLIGVEEQDNPYIVAWKSPEQHLHLPHLKQR